MKLCPPLQYINSRPSASSPRRNGQGLSGKTRSWSGGKAYLTGCLSSQKAFLPRTIFLYGAMAFDVGFKTEKPFQELVVTPGDLTLGSIVFGFFFGFAIHVAWTAVKETRRAGRFSAYIFMVWLEISASSPGDTCTSAASVCFCLSHMSLSAKILPPGLPVFLFIVILWVCQVQCLMLIIVNRLCILYSDERQRVSVVIPHPPVHYSCIVTAISLSTTGVWIPAQLQINQTYIWKSVYLLLDLTLNILFIRVVKTRLINYGLTKYDRVMKFNEYIIFVSISMDILLLGVTGLHNPFVYCQFHPVVYIVKLHIEMTMSRQLILTPCAKLLTLRLRTSHQ
ncbi:hypothetical protein BDZ89DRAFT_1060917, partial [Hymenopellis radicata]